MAARYWSGNATGTSPNWNYNSGGITNWSSASGITPDNVLPPTSADDVTFDGATGGGLAPNANTNSTISANINCLSLTITSGYTATMTHSGIIDIYGSWTMNNSHTIAGSSSIAIRATSTITSNGQTWPNNLSFQTGSGGTVTLSGNFTVSGSLSTLGSFATTINHTTTEMLYVAGLSISIQTIGNIDITLTGGTWTNPNANFIPFNVTIAGNITLGSSVKYGTGTLTWSSGTVDTTTNNSTLTLSASCTLDTDGMTWNNVTISSGTHTLISDMTVDGTTTSGGVINKTTTEIWYTASLAVNLSTTGTAEIILTGGTWSGSNTTGIANNLTINGNVTVSGTVYYRTGVLKYTSGTVTVTSSTLGITASCTLNTNGMSWNNISNMNTSTITFTSNCLALGPFKSITAGCVLTATTSETLTCHGLGLESGGSFSVTGTVKLIITGGTITTQSTSRNIGVSYDLDGDVTYSGSTDHSGTITITYISGTINTTGHTLNVGECTAVTLNTSGVNWNNVTEGPITLTSDLNVYGTFSKGQVQFVNKTTSEVVNIYGTLSITHPGTGGTGTATFKMQSGSTWSGITAMRQNLEFVGNSTISGTVGFGVATITYTSGTITTTASTLNLVAACTINTNGMIWNNVTLTGAVTTTINSLFSIAATLLMTGSNTFAGTAGFTCATLSNTSAVAGTVSFKESITYTITTSFSCYQSRNGPSVLFTSSHASLRANLVMVNPSLCNVLGNFTRISAAGGRTINTFSGVITDCENIRQFFDYQGVSSL